MKIFLILLFYVQLLFAGIWFALKEYLIEGLIYDHDVGISVLVFEVLGHLRYLLEGRGLPIYGDNDDEDEEMEEVGEEELIIFHKCVGLS